METKDDQLLAEITEVEALEYELAERKLSAFIQFAWEVLEPGKPLLWNWHLELICEYLEDLYYGQLRGEARRLIINEPPRNLKSIAVTVCFPAWVWIQKTKLPGMSTEVIGASKRFLSTSYAQSLATKHALDTRTLIESDWYQRGWGDRFSLSQEQDTKMEYLNDKRGHRIATSMHGTATGKGGDILIVDDPHDTTIAESDQRRQETINAFDLKFTSRLDNKKTGAIILVMQRLHQLDLTGHLLAKGGWQHLCLPAEAEEPQTLAFPISGKVIHREVGDLLHPEREGPDELSAIKRAQGSQGYAGQYQQRPTAREGGIIKRAWTQNFYKVLPDRVHDRTQSWDCAFKDTGKSDFVAGQVWIRSEGNFYLVDRVKDRMDIVGTMGAIRTMSAKHPKVITKLVEDKANGPAVIQLLKTKIPGLIPVTPEGSKESRVSAIAPLWESGNVYLPDPSIAPWVHDFIEEIVNFPNAANDDECDAMTQALLRLAKGLSNSFTKNLNPNKIKSLSSDYRGADAW